MDLSLILETRSNPSKDHQVWAFAQKHRPNFAGR
jgi:hypothetical protein